MGKKGLLVAFGAGLVLLVALSWLLSSGLPVRSAPAPELHVCPVGCAYSSIQAAVDGANPGDVIKVAQGVYTGVQNVPSLNTTYFTATQIVAINKSITIRGGYTTTNWTTPYPELQPTTLDAQGEGRVLVVSGAITVTIEGLRITGGTATGLGGVPSVSSVAGGGVYVNTATVNIANCNIYNNAAHSTKLSWANGSGGGLYLGGSSYVTLQENVISGNTATMKGYGSGGGLYLDECDYATLRGNVISGSIGTIGNNGLGGGLHLHDSDYATLDGNTIIDNVGSYGANYSGGGLYLGSSDHVTLTGNVVKGNIAGSSWSEGGGLYLAGSDYATLIGNTFEDNTASTYRGWGGGLYLSLCKDLIFSGNVVVTNKGNSHLSQPCWGGGMYIWHGGPFKMTNNQ